ncbi:MAG: integrase/recombinase XerD [Streptomyces sp.]|nr:integrase/recombinase XerD [Streptomyces sp.]
MSRGLSRPAEDFLRWLAEERGRAANTVAAYRADLVAYEAALAAGGLTVGQADGEVVGRYISDLTAAGRKPSSVARAAVAIRALHRYLGQDVSAVVESPLVPVSDQDVLSYAEVDRLLASVAGDGAVERRDRAILHMLYVTGMRSSELVALNVEDVVAGGRRVQVAGDSARRRMLVLGPDCTSAVEKWLASAGLGALGRLRRQAPLFVNTRAGRLSRQGAWVIVRHRGSAGGLGDRLTPQVLRNTCAAHLLESGLSPRTVQERLGQVMGRPRRY